MSAQGVTLPDWLAARAASAPVRIALVANGHTWTFAQLDAHVTRVARRLEDVGVRAGDRIATLLHDGVAGALLPHAALRLGAVLVPLNVRLGDAELAWQLQDAAPRVLVTDARMRARTERASQERPALLVVSVDEVIVRPSIDAVGDDDPRPALRTAHDADDLLAVIYTSGTTGRPKGAMLTVGNFWWSAIGSALNLGTHTDDRWLACLPLFHVGGLSIILRAAIYGIAAVVHDEFDADRVNAAIDDEGVTIVSVVAVMLQRMLDARDDRPYPSSLRCVLLGGGPAPRSLLDRCAALGVPVVQTYGLTETCSQLATLAPEDALRRPGSAGKALYPNELRLASTADDGAGEILVKGPVVMAGYANQLEATRAAIVDGWLHTGDIGRIDADGFLHVLDRRDDLIVTGGENVYPAEVEAAILSHPSIAEAGVIGIADETWGQRVVAVVRPADSAAGIDAAELTSHCRERIAGYKVPREIRVVVEPLPRTASGKLRRSALRTLITPPEGSPGVPSDSR